MEKKVRIALRAYKAIAAMAISAAIMILSFQNCVPNFQAIGTAQLMSLSQLGQNPVPLQIVDSKGKAVTNNATITVDEPYAVSVKGVQIPAGTVVVWNGVAKTAGAAVHVHNGASTGEAELHCEAAGTIELSGTVTSSGTSYNTEIYTFNCIDSPTPTPTPQPITSTVEFRIPAGTGSGPWNTQATTVKVYVGQVLKIINDDTMVHRMHTGGAPCPHQPNNSATGQSYDCVVTQAVSSQSGTPAYDHNIGTGAKFWVDSFNGPQLYSTSCQSCHGAIATSEVRNRSFAQIKAAIASESQMASITLNDDQLKAIEYSLNH